MRSSRRRRLRSHKLRAILILAVIVAGLGGGTDLAYAAVRTQADQLQAQLTTELQAGQTELEAGKTSLTQANSNHDASLVPEATAHFAAAKEKFLAAGSLADNSQLLRDLEFLPSVGEIARSRHTAVSGIAAMGAAISDAGQDLAALDGELIKPSASGPAGRTLLTVLDQTNTGLIKVRADFGRAQKAAWQVDISVVPQGQQATFLKARDTIAAALAGLDEFERLVPVFVEVLGGNGPRTYLIEQVNPAELRAGGGFIGSYSLIRADQGTLTVVRSGNATELAEPRPQRGQPGWVPELGPLREVIPNESWSLLDSNVFPDFPSNAMAAEQWVQPRLNMPVDGVISIDYYAVTKMLELTGPLAVPGYPTVNATNFIPLIIQPDIAGDPGHKAILASVAGPLMARVAALPPESWPALLGAFNEIAAEHHLQAYFNNGTVQTEIDRIGWSGNLRLGVAHDYLMEVESNYYGDKVNYFLSRHYTLVLTRVGSTLHHQLTVDLINGEPYGSEDRTSYKVDVRLYVPEDASAVSDNLIPVKYANPAPPAGSRLLGGWLPLVSCCGGKGHAVFEYDTPWPVHDRGIDQIYWQKQPGTLADTVAVTWDDGSGRTHTVGGNLTQDLVIKLTAGGVALGAGQPGLATLPSLSLG